MKPEDDDTNALEHSLEIDADYRRMPSEIKDRIEAIDDPEGKEYEIARGNMLSVMKLGGEALSDIASLAAQSSHPRMFEAMNELAKTMIQANRELMEIKRMEEKSQQEKGRAPGAIGEGGGTTNNVLIQCTPAQLIDMMKDAKKKKTIDG